MIYGFVMVSIALYPIFLQRVSLSIAVLTVSKGSLFVKYKTEPLCKRLNLLLLWSCSLL